MTTQSQKPIAVYITKEITRGGKQSTAWIRGGAAFPHKDGVGLNIHLDVLPMDGKLVVLPPRDREESAG